MRSDVYSITLAAGAGRRMLEDMPAKPCCMIGPISVMENAFQTYEEARVLRHVVVVGRRAEEVMDEVHRSRPRALLAYQSEPRGTGDAVRCAMDLLAELGPPAHVLISYGDKVVDPRVVKGLLETCIAERLDLGLVAGPSDHYPASGRIVVRNHRAAAILEVPDIQVRQLAARLRSLKPHEWPENVGALKDLTVQHVPNTAKLARSFPALSALLGGPSDVPVPVDQVRAAAESIPEDFALRGGTISLEEAAASQLCNLSVYVGRFEPLYQAVQELGAENVQGEFYFTDVVDILTASSRKVGLFRIEDPEDVMAFNTLEDLEAVRKVHAIRALSRTRYPSLEAWNGHFARREPGGLSADAVRLLAQKTGPERPCVVVRSPGRINLMGRHVDHQGGRCNLMAIDRQIVIAASPRDDDRVNLWNAEAADYPPRSFTFRELTTDIVWGDWLRTLDSQYLRRMVSRSAGEWVNYVKGAALRLQHRFPDRPLRGMDAFVTGDIPVGAGLSSSTALVVAVVEALAEINALNLRPREFVDLCGEGEWFVGTRGEAGDHAAIKFGRPNEVVTVSFFPFEVVGRQPFPEDCGIIICHSGVPAENVQGTRERLNARVACYHIAREVIKREFPRFAPRIEHLRDVNTRTLDISLPALYGVVRAVPTRMDATQIEAFAADHPTVAKSISDLNLEEHDFPLRDVVLYGLAECERSWQTGALLETGDVGMLGRMMNVSHDGDRVARWDPECVAFDSRATDERMEALIRGAGELRQLGDSGAALWQQPGAYDCSTREMDLMVDVALKCPGVLGAQLAGAGLVGSIMVLLRRDCVDSVLATLEREYTERQGVEPHMFVCGPSEGSQVLTSVEPVR